MRDCLDRIGDYYCHPGMAGDFYEWKIKEFVLLMLKRASFLHDKKIHPIRYTPSQINSTHDARDFLVSDLKNCPTIKEVAEKSILNQCILKSCFNHIYGKPIHQYFIEQKMNAAKKLLLDPNLKIFEICDMLGYDDKQNFYNAFKKYFKITPGQWCKENNVIRLGSSEK
jgi:AraC-like DNA-binding protein